MRIAPTLPKDHVMAVCLSGRGDKDLASVLSAVEKREKQST